MSSRSGEACCELLYPVTLFYLPSLAASSDVADSLSLAANDCTNILTRHHDPEHTFSSSVIRYNSSVHYHHRILNNNTITTLNRYHQVNTVLLLLQPTSSPGSYLRAALYYRLQLKRSTTKLNCINSLILCRLNQQSQTVVQ